MGRRVDMRQLEQLGRDVKPVVDAHDIAAFDQRGDHPVQLADAATRASARSLSGRGGLRCGRAVPGCRAPFRVPAPNRPALPALRTSLRVSSGRSFPSLTSPKTRGAVYHHYVRVAHCGGYVVPGATRCPPGGKSYLPVWCTSMMLPSGSWKKIWYQPFIAHVP